jgi:Protein of unknown function (DUF2971)
MGIPERLYKYQPIHERAEATNLEAPDCSFEKLIETNYSLQNLSKKQVWFEDPTTFNDPLDGVPPIAYTDLPKSWGTGHLRANLSRVWNIACFSERNDNTQMWSHYASKHTGFCIEFDTSYEPFRHALRVKYSDKPLKIRKSMKPSIKEIEGRILSVATRCYDITPLETKMLTLKAMDWEYEREWRVIHPKPCGRENKIQPQCITAIYFGAAMKKSRMFDISRLLQGADAPAFYRMQWDEKTFRLTPNLFRSQ